MLDMAAFNDIWSENERLKNLFDHTDWQEEGGLSAHIHDVSHLDRHILEVGYCINSKVLVPHPSSHQPPWRFRPEIIARRARISFVQAVELSKCMAALDFTDLMTNNLIRQIQKGGFTMARKTKKLAEAVEKVTTIPENDAMEHRTEGPVGDEPTASGAQLDSYHKLGDDESISTWLDMQPRKFCCLYRAIQHCPKLSGLQRLGAYAYNFNMIGIQERPLWDLYRIRRDSLFAHNGSPSAKQAVEKIQSASYKHLRQLGAYLYHHGQAKIPDRAQLSYVWAQYRDRKTIHESEILFEQS